MPSCRKPGPLGMEVEPLDPNRGQTTLCQPVKAGPLGIDAKPNALQLHSLSNAQNNSIAIRNPSVDIEFDQLTELREQLRIALKQMVTEVASRSRLLEQELQAQNYLDQKLIFTGAFLAGLYEAGKSVVVLASDAMVALDKASTQFKRALFQAIQTQSTEHLQKGFLRVMQEASEAKQTMEEVSERIELLHDDDQTWQMLTDFPGRYWSNLHSTDKAKLAGSLSFDMLLAFLTLGAGVAASVLSKSRYFKKAIDSLDGILKILKKKQRTSKHSSKEQTSAGGGAASTPSEVVEKAGGGGLSAKESKKKAESDEVVIANKKSLGLNKNEKATRDVSNVTVPIDFDGHILSGEVKPNGSVVGGHSTANNKVRVVPGTQSQPNAQGVYTAQIEVPDPTNPGQFLRKTNNGGMSTMFPDTWTADRVKVEVDAAFKNKVVTGNKWKGVTPSGVAVEGWLIPKTTVYPIY